MELKLYENWRKKPIAQEVSKACSVLEMGNDKLLSDIDSLCIEVIKMLVSSINTARRNLNN